jgi:AraC-like DNA-binding protein
MLIAHRVPKPPLSEFVELLWFYEGLTQAHEKERLLPQGSAELVINLAQDQIRIYDRQDSNTFETLRGAVVCGPHSQFFVIDTSQQYAVLGVHFKAGGVFPFLGLPAGELHNAHVSLIDIWGRAASALRDRLLESPSTASRFDVLERALLTRLTAGVARHPAVAFALQELARARVQPAVSCVTRKIGLSERRFSQVFGDQVGLSPKLYSRVQRFQQVLRQVGRPGPTTHGIDWTEIALSCGYYDQAHFNHDFREFSGINPTAYASYRTEHLNHVPITTGS